MKFLFLYLMLLISVTCLGQRSEVDLKSYFSETEIKDLNLIADFFQKEFCGTSDRTKFGSCIKMALPKLVNWEQKYLQKKISWRKQKKIYSIVSDSTFSKIWGFCKITLLGVEPNYKYESICFSYNKTFIEFVRSLEESNDAIKGYADKLESIGSFTPLKLIMDSIYNPLEDTDLDNRGVQILLAIHFLTKNDEMKRDKKAIRLQNRSRRIFERKFDKKKRSDKGRKNNR